MTVLPIFETGMSMLFKTWVFMTLLEAEVALLLMETVSALMFEAGMSTLFETRMSMM